MGVEKGSEAEQDSDSEDKKPMVKKLKIDPAHKDKSKAEPAKKSMDKVKPKKTTKRHR